MQSDNDKTIKETPGNQNAKLVVRPTGIATKPTATVENTGYLDLDLPTSQKHSSFQKIEATLEPIRRASDESQEAEPVESDHEHEHEYPVDRKYQQMQMTIDELRSIVNERGEYIAALKRELGQMDQNHRDLDLDQHHHDRFERAMQENDTKFREVYDALRKTEASLDQEIKKDPIRTLVYKELQDRVESTKGILVEQYKILDDLVQIKGLSQDALRSHESSSRTLGQHMELTRELIKGVNEIQNSLFQAGTQAVQTAGNLNRVTEEAAQRVASFTGFAERSIARVMERVEELATSVHQQVDHQHNRVVNNANDTESRSMGRTQARSTISPQREPQQRTNSANNGPSEEAGDSYFNGYRSIINEVARDAHADGEFSIDHSPLAIVKQSYEGIKETVAAYKTPFRFEPNASKIGTFFRGVCAPQHSPIAAPVFHLAMTATALFEFGSFLLKTVADLATLSFSDAWNDTKIAAFYAVAAAGEALMIVADTVVKTGVVVTRLVSTAFGGDAPALSSDEIVDNRDNHVMQGSR